MMRLTMISTVIMDGLVVAIITCYYVRFQPPTKGLYITSVIDAWYEKPGDN